MNLRAATILLSKLTMAQLPFGSGCETILTKLRPDLTPPDLGTYTIEQVPKCKDNLPRRSDTGPPKWKDSPPIQDTVNGRDNLVGLSSRAIGRTQLYATPVGRIGLTSEPMTYAYMPSSVSLDLAWAGDTRISGISDRYYR